MFPVLARIGPVTLYSYGLMMALGFWCGAQLASAEYRRRGGDPELFWKLALYCFVAALVTSHLWWWIGAYRQGQASAADLVSGSGHVWFAGLLGGLTTGWWLTRRQSLDTLAVLDSAALGIPVGHALGRIGCHLAGDGDWGKVTDVAWGVTYPRAIIGWPYPAGVRVHPTPLYEAAAYAAIFGLLWLYRRSAPRGALIGVCLALTSLARWTVELWRLNPVVAFGLSEAQLVSMALFALGGWLWLRSRRQAPSRGGPPQGGPSRGGPSRGAVRA
jgi:phosphatidylglycerol---prolipoprotein diacylglyceryl transferase